MDQEFDGFPIVYDIETFGTSGLHTCEQVLVIAFIHAMRAFQPANAFSFFMFHRCFTVPSGSLH